MKLHYHHHWGIMITTMSTIRKTMMTSILILGDHNVLSLHHLVQDYGEVDTEESTHLHHHRYFIEGHKSIHCHHEEYHGVSHHIHLLDNLDRSNYHKEILLEKCHMVRLYCHWVYRLVLHQKGFFN